MARDLTQLELDALNASGDLLIYAAENVKDLAEATVSTINAAQDAKEAKTWDEAIATKFWLAFNGLCTLIKPVTLDTLRTNVRTIEQPKLKFWRSGELISLSGRSAGRYLFLLMFLLCVAVVLGFLASVETKLNSDVEKLIVTGNEVTDKIVSEANSPQLVLVGSTKFQDVKDPDQAKLIGTLQSQIQDQNFLLTQMFQKINIMVRLGSWGRRGYPYQPGSNAPVQDMTEVLDAIQNYYTSRQQVSGNLLQESVLTTIITSSILPIVLGLMGACAYIVRLISDQIKDTTFSATSPVRHMVRLALGGLTGVVIGFAGVVNLGTLSPSALAFIAGYAVEPVFATFDSIAAKFRQ